VVVVLLSKVVRDGVGRRRRRQEKESSEYSLPVATRALRGGAGAAPEELRESQVSPFRFQRFLRLGLEKKKIWPSLYRRVPSVEKTEGSI
jgi:hypothetical protein